MAAPHSEAFSARRMVFEFTVLVERCSKSRSGMTERPITPKGHSGNFWQLGSVNSTAVSMQRTVQWFHNDTVVGLLQRWHMLGWLLPMCHV